MDAPGLKSYKYIGPTSPSATLELQTSSSFGRHRMSARNDLPRLVQDIFQALDPGEWHRRSFSTPLGPVAAPGCVVTQADDEARWW